MEEQQNQKPNRQIQEDALQDKQQTSNHTKIHNSQHLSSYLDIMGIEHIEEFSKSRQELLKKLQAQRLKFDFSSDQKLEFNITGASKNYECFQLDVRYNNFFFSIFLININQQSPNHKIQKCYEGNFSSVYHTIYNKQNIAIKCSKFRHKTFLKVFQDTLSYQFKAGPSMSDMFWFGLIIYKNCIEFTMEFCSHKLEVSTLAHDLKHSLQYIHSLKIIHSDIKPQNISFSKQFGRNVFIDFGLHRVIKQQLGHKTHTNFKGSLLFCSKQMRQCFTKGQSLIDLYYNDAVCLEASIKEIQRQNNKRKIQKYAVAYNQTPISVLIKIKYLLWNIDQFRLVDQKANSYHNVENLFLT